MEHLHVKLNEFKMEDDNSFYLVNRILKKTKEVKRNPDVLGYEVLKNETGKSPDQLLQRALQKVRGRK